MAIPSRCPAQGGVRIRGNSRKGFPMSATLGELAKLVEGRLVGDGSIEVLGAATLLDAGPGDITFVDRDEKAEKLAATHARAAIVPAGFPADRLTMPPIALADVHQAFTRIVLPFRPARSSGRLGISPRAIVSPSAQIAEDVDIHAGATVGDDVV